MNREEAIEILKAHHMWTGEPQEIIDVRKENKALEMAIQALSQEPCDDAEQIDYHDDFATALKKIKDYEQKSIEDMPCVTPEEMQKYKDIVKKYTPKQEPCDDATPCDFCRYNPPSSTDGKPCCMCPATPYQKGGKK